MHWIISWQVHSGPLTCSIRTIGSICVQTSAVSPEIGSALTTFASPLDTIPDLPDFRSASGGSPSRTPLLILSHHTRATSDNEISGPGYLYPGGSRVVAPSRSGSLRRTSSMTDLDAFQTVLRRASDAKPGLEFGLSFVGVLTGYTSPRSPLG